MMWLWPLQIGAVVVGLDTEFSYHKLAYATSTSAHNPFTLLDSRVWGFGVIGALWLAGAARITTLCAVPIPFLRYRKFQLNFVTEEVDL